MHLANGASLRRPAAARHPTDFLWTRAPGNQGGRCCRNGKNSTMYFPGMRASPSPTSTSSIILIIGSSSPEMSMSYKTLLMAVAKVLHHGQCYSLSCSRCASKWHSLANVATQLTRALVEPDEELPRSGYLRRLIGGHRFWPEVLPKRTPVSSPPLTVGHCGHEHVNPSAIDRHMHTTC